MVTPWSRSQATLLSPRRNHSSSTAIDLKCTFFVVTSGKVSDRSYRSRSPKRLTVPVPVRSCFGVPCSRIRRRRSSYWVSIGAATCPRLRPGTDGREAPGAPATGGSALTDQRAGGHLAAVGQGADPEVAEHVGRHPLQLPQAGDGQRPDLDVGVLAGPHGHEVPPGAVVAGDDDPRLGGVGQHRARRLPG